VEKLLEREGIVVSVETVRRMQIGLGLWRPKHRRQKRLFQLRERRPRFGELIQIDGSPHAWFEDRGPRCALIVFIDDATSRLTALRFAPTETTRAYLEALRSHVLAHGCPLAFYSDRHSRCANFSILCTRQSSFHCPSNLWCVAAVRSHTARSRRAGSLAAH
jgi:hypothetical protein